MFVGCGIMIVGPERREDKPRGKRYYGISVTLQRPTFMRRKETLKAISHKNTSSDTLLPSYVNTPKLEWLPEKLPELLPQILISFEPHDFDFKQLGERYRAIKAENRDGGRRCDALSLQSKMDGKLYESIETVEKE
jgi:hypothetical protein